MRREVLAVQKRVLGVEHPDTPTVAKNFVLGHLPLSPRDARGGGGDGCARCWRCRSRCWGRIIPTR